MTRHDELSSTRKKKLTGQIPEQRYADTQIDHDKLQPWLYRTLEDSELVLVWMTWTQREEKQDMGFLFLPDGREARFSMYDQLEYEGKGSKSPTRIRTRAKWPLRTAMTGVGEHQVGELREFVQQQGLVGTEVNNDGSVTWSGPAARKRYCQATGLYDRNAGYSDPAPRNR